MKVAGKKVAKEFADRHAEARSAIAALVAELEEAVWAGPHELKLRYPSASVLGKGRVVFNVKGNKFRVLALVNYPTQTVQIRRIGTHAEYDTWNL